jgi:hypothetical protein
MRKPERPLPGRLGLLLLVALLSQHAVGAATETTPPTLKAAFLYNFAKFAEWPRDPDAAAPLTLCVLHDQASEAALAQLVSGASLNGRPIIVLRAVSHERLRSCHLLYIADAEGQALDDVLAELRGMPVLTVGNGEPFARHGGIVGLLVEGNRMRFAINPDAAQRSGVRLSSKLLSLATLVND